ncbi:MAG: metalloregulator ArsR/SmtB family transcription factor [Planctomycetota bacterium]
MRRSEATPGGLGGALRLFAEPLRLRILGLLEREELSVGELSRALALSQSRVSNHLRPLREAGLLGERHAGTTTHLRLAPPGRNGAVARRLWTALREELPALPEHGADLVRLERVLAARRAAEGELFDTLAVDWDKLAGAFATGQGRLRAATHLLPPGLVVADLGCGTGYMAEALLGVASRVIGVDRSAGMLEEARRRLSRAPRGTAVELRRGELDALPIADGEVDAALAGLVLHHLPALDPGIREMARILKPGGTLAILELAPHGEAWMKRALGDRRLGLEPGDVLAALERAGFTGPLLDPVEDAYRPRRPDAAPGDEEPRLTLYVVRARAPASRGDKNR